jgi:hypothetical protein
MQTSVKLGISVGSFMMPTSVLGVGLYVCEGTCMDATVCDGDFV